MGNDYLNMYIDNLEEEHNSVYYKQYLEQKNMMMNLMNPSDDAEQKIYPAYKSYVPDPDWSKKYVENSYWKNQFDKMREENPDLLVEARKNSVNNPYEMDCMSRLYQSKMKWQCRTYKTAWEADNEKLSALGNTFSSSQTSIEMEGDTANNIWELFADYCAIIQCMQMGILFDLEDNDALYNKLGDVDLDGSVILHGIESARTNYYNECTAHDNSVSAAISTSDEDFSRWLWSEARRHAELANSYHDEWMHYEDLKSQYERINADSMKFYLTGTEYRTLAQEGMDILATAYDGAGSYVVPAGFAGWRTQFDEKNKAKILEYASKWKDENGEWDMEALGEEISIDDVEEIDNLDCIALCYVLDDLYMESPENPEKIQQLLNYGIIEVYEPILDESGNNTGYGYWQYKTSAMMNIMTNTYGVYMNGQDIVATDEISVQQHHNIYNILYSVTNIIGDSEVFYGAENDVEKFESGLYDHNRFELKLSYDKATYEYEGHTCECNFGYYTIDYGIYSVDDGNTVIPLKTVAEESLRIYDYSPKDQSTQMLDGSNWCIDNTGNVDMDEAQRDATMNIVNCAAGEVPVFGKAYGLATTIIDYKSALEEAEQAQAEKEQRDVNIKIVTNANVLFERLDIQASYVYSADGSMYILSYTVGRSDLEQYVEEFVQSNKKYESFTYDSNTVVDDYIYSGNASILSEFLDYVDAQKLPSE